MKQGTGAFTLIELLIVVAIIGILAAIAVPSFLNARIRAKVARAYSDIRSLRTAVESYYIDNNAYPNCDTLERVNGVQFRGGEIVEPIAYMSAIPSDPFNAQEGAHAGTTFDKNEYFYVNDGPGGFWVDILLFASRNSTPPRENVKYLISSQGPDDLSEIQVRRLPVEYASSNGLVTSGDIAVFGP